MKSNQQNSSQLGPSPIATAILLAALAYCWLFVTGDTAYDIAHHAAIAVGLSIGLGFLYELRAGGLRNLFRMDLVCLLGLYGLTLSEFLFPQPLLNEQLNQEQVRVGLELIYLGIGSLVLGRHLIRSDIFSNQLSFSMPTIPPSLLTLAVAGAFGIGFLFMFLAVEFNLLLMIEYMLGPRFAVPWQRSRYGGLDDLLNELNLITYIIPPIVGYTMVRRKDFQFWQKSIIYSVFLFTMFAAFTAGTRNVLAVHMATFAIGFVFSLKRIKIFPLATLSFTILGTFIFLSYHMLEFRNMGLKHYLESQHYDSSVTRNTLFIDFNLVPISQLAERFPGEYRYLGWEVPFWALVKPFPRAFWPGKPKGLSLGIEQALGHEQMTVAVTFIGESYMAAGRFGVIIAGLLFGALFAWWNRVASGGGSLSIILYAVGFYGGIISMRSLFWLTTAMLPAIALLVFAKVIIPTFFPSLDSHSGRKDSFNSFSKMHD